MVNHGLTMVHFSKAWSHGYNDHGQPWFDNGPFLKSMVNHGHDHGQPWLTMVHFSKAWSTIVIMTILGHGQPWSS